MVADIGQGTLNAVIAPAGILLREPQDEIDDDLADTRPADIITLLALIPLLGHQFAVPAEDGVGGHNRGQFLQCLASEGLAFHCYTRVGSKLNRTKGAVVSERPLKVQF